MTQHQWDILIAVADHGDAQMAADHLGISVHTVKNILAKVRAKTDTVTTLSAYHHLLRD